MQAGTRLLPARYVTALAGGRPPPNADDGRHTAVEDATSGTPPPPPHTHTHTHLPVSSHACAVVVATGRTNQTIQTQASTARYL